MAEFPASLPGRFSFHHLGYATRSIEQERATLAALGYRQSGQAFIDPAQGIAGCFLAGPGPRLELLENLPGATTLTPWLNAGVKLYHLAYAVRDLKEAADWVAGVRGRIVVPPTPAVAFDGQLISFAMLRNSLMIEFIESAALQA